MSEIISRLLQEVLNNPNRETVGVLADALEEAGDSRSSFVRNLPIPSGRQWNHCPRCGNDNCRYRTGLHFENQLRCPRCEVSWEPEPTDWEEKKRRYLSVFSTSLRLNLVEYH